LHDMPVIDRSTVAEVAWVFTWVAPKLLTDREEDVDYVSQLDSDRTYVYRQLRTSVMAVLPRSLHHESRDGLLDL
jgi:hypothetical protein